MSSLLLLGAGPTSGGGVPVTPPFVQDSFTDAQSNDLFAHTGEIGATWTKHPATSTGAVNFDDQNRIRVATTVSSNGYASGTPATADYDVEADISFVTVLAGTVLGVWGRLDTTALTGYLARWAQSQTGWQLYQFVNGTGTQIGSTFTQSQSNGSSRHVKLRMRGSDIRLVLDGTDVITGTNSTITSAGRAGVNLASSSVPSVSTGGRIDNFAATDA